MFIKQRKFHFLISQLYVHRAFLCWLSQAQSFLSIHFMLCFSGSNRHGNSALLGIAATSVENTWTLEAFL